MNVCVPRCDPLLVDCSEHAVCVPEGDDFFCVPDNSGDEGQAADMCSWGDDCDPGLYCLEADAVSADCIGSCCTEFCSLLPRDPNAACSIEGTVCVPFFDDPPPPLYDQVGVCVLQE